VETYDGGLAAVGYGRVNNDSEEYRVRLYRTDSEGNQIWEKAYTNVNGCNTYGMTETSDRGFAVVGYTGAYGNYDMFLLRTDSLGDSLWFNTYGGDLDEQAEAIAETDDGGFLIVGETESSGAGSSDIFVVRVSSSGDSLWSQTFGDTLSDHGHGIIKTGDGAYVIVGNKIFTDPALESRMYLIKIQDNGDTAWTSSILGGTSAAGYSVCEANDGGYIMVGVASYGYPKDEDVLIARLDADGDSLWAVNYGGNAYDIGKFVYQDSEGYIYVGATYAASGYADYYALKLTETVADVDIDENPGIPGSIRLSQNSPNPFNAATMIDFYIPRTGHVELEIYNLLGQKIKTLIDKAMPPGPYTAYWDGTDEENNIVASGTYFYRLKAGTDIKTKKMILLK
jgi:hypothetical protein